VPHHYDFLSTYRADPEGEALSTPSGRIEIFSERIASFSYDDCPATRCGSSPLNGSAHRKPTASCI